MFSIKYNSDDLCPQRLKNIYIHVDGDRFQFIGFLNFEISNFDAPPTSSADFVSSESNNIVTSRDIYIYTRIDIKFFSKRSLLFLLSKLTHWKQKLSRNLVSHLKFKFECNVSPPRRTQSTRPNQTEIYRKIKTVPTNRFEPYHAREEGARDPPESSIVSFDTPLTPTHIESPLRILGKRGASWIGRKPG